MDESTRYEVDAQRTSKGYLFLDAIEEQDENITKSNLKRKAPKSLTIRLIEAAKKGWLNAGSDGSFRPLQMASSYWFGNPTDPIIRTRSVPVPTYYSYRSELDGINNFLDLLHTLPDDLSPQTFTFSLDKESAVTFGNSPHMEIKSYTVDKNYFAHHFHIFTRLQSTKNTVNFVWVKSHTDDNKKWEDLTIIERNNVLCEREDRSFSSKHRSQ